MSKNLLIVFVKNIKLGKVKTRLAKTVGDQSAFEVYKHLVHITEQETLKMENCDLHIYFSDVIIEEKWLGSKKFVQEGADLGERMHNAFKHGFDSGYTNIIGVGSDLPDLTAEIMIEGLNKLKKNDSVFGPSEDGGYYLIGMNTLIHQIFENKSWSTDILLDQTIEELNALNYSSVLLKELNDVDTVEDLAASSISGKFRRLLVK
jgi:rSAM/selenodomain-associated transferase 1